MSLHTIKHPVQILGLLYENQHCVKIVFEKLLEFYGLHNRLSVSTICRSIEKLKDTCSVEDQKIEKYTRSARSQQNINSVPENVAEDPEMSIRRRSYQ